MVALFYALWAGEIIGLSFIATPAKFLATDLTVPQLLLVGRATFGVQQWIETGFIILLLGLVFYRTMQNTLTPIEIINVVVVGTLYLVQYYWVLPILDARVTLIQTGADVPSSNLHSIYVIIELAKIVSLGITSYVCLKS